MADPFVGEVRLFAGTFAPQGWALCDGRLLAISQSEVLYTLIGTTYGGNGVFDFALPDLTLGTGLGTIFLRLVAVARLLVVRPRTAISRIPRKRQVS